MSLAPIVSAEDQSIPNLEIAQLIYRYENASKNNESIIELKQLIVTALEADKMVVTYLELANKFSWTIDEIQIQNWR